MSRVETKSVGLLACSNLVFHAFDFVVGALVTINAIVLLFQTRSLAGFILPLYFTVAGIIIVAFTMYAHPKLYAALIFYFSFIGRGLTFLFIGTVFLAFNDDFSTATGVITIIVAFVYLIFSIWTKFCKLYCPLPPPFTQRQDGIGGKTSSDNDQQADTSGNHGDNELSLQHCYQLSADLRM